MVVIAVSRHFGHAVGLDDGSERFQSLVGGSRGFRFKSEDLNQAVLELSQQRGARYEPKVSGESKLQKRPRGSAGRRNRGDQNIGVEYDRRN